MEEESYVSLPRNRYLHNHQQMLHLQFTEPRQMRQIFTKNRINEKKRQRKPIIPF